MGSVSGDSGHGSSHTDAYDELFHTPTIVDLDLLDNDQEETGNKVSFGWLYKDESWQEQLCSVKTGISVHVGVQNLAS